MPGVLAGRGCAVVTGRARAENLCVVNVQYRLPNSRRVAALTNVRRKNVLRILTGRDGAVMTANAVAGYVRMIEIRGQPGDGSMAIITVVAARDVCRMFARGRGAVVTGSATTQYLRVIYGNRRNPYRDAVTILANVCG